jgi:hypothetical protein
MERDFHKLMKILFLLYFIDISGKNLYANLCANRDNKWLEKLAKV